MSPTFQRLAFATLLAASSTAFAQVTVKDAWIRATVPQQKATGAFMTIVSDKDTRLVAARSSRVPVVEVHEMKMENNTMRMREVAGIDVQAGKPLDLTPGGYHIMLMNLAAQVKPGDAIPLTLDFVDRDGRKQSIDVTATARPLTESAPAKKGHHGH